MFGIREEVWKNINGFNTATEIYQQPELWLETLQIIQNNIEKIKGFFAGFQENKNTRVIFAGAGTSAYIGETLVPYLQRKYNYRFEAIPTTHIVTNPENYLEKDTTTIIISFGRSGNSPESMATFNLAEQLINDVHHIFITCNPDGEMAKTAKDKKNILLLLMPEKSNDKGFAMTSSLTCMMLAALLIFDIQNLENYSKQLAEIANIGKNILDNNHQKLSELLNSTPKRVIYLGSGSFYGLSKESALKLLELTRGKIIGYSESVLGFRHGPKSIVNDETLVFIFLSQDAYSKKYDIDLLKEIYNDPGDHTVIAISANFENDLKEICDDLLYLPEEAAEIDNPILISMLYILYAQVFALLASVKSGIEPDNPNPGGIVNRVVKGVNIYPYCKIN